MKKIAVLLFFVFYSCTIEYDGETKIVIKGKILTSQNIPLPNQEVKLLVRRESFMIPFVFYLPSESNFIGTAKTNSKGEYIMVIPKPTKNYNEIIVQINEEENQFNKMQIRNIKTDNFSNYEVNLGISTIFLKSELVQLQIIPTPLSANRELISITYIGEVSREIVYFNPLENESIYYQTFSLVKKNQNLILEYSVKDYLSDTISTSQQTIFINNDNITFQLNY